MQDLKYNFKILLVVLHLLLLRLVSIFY